MNSYQSTLDELPAGAPADGVQPDEHSIPWSALYAEEYLAAAGMLVIVGSVIWGVITRYLLATSADWVTEMAAIAFAWTVFVGAAAVFARGEHSAVDLFVSACPPGLRRIVQLAADVIVLATLAVIAIIAIRFTIATADVPTTVMRIPQSIVYGAAAVGFSLMALRHGLFAVRRFRGGRTS